MGDVSYEYLNMQEKAEKTIEEKTHS